MAKAKPAAAPEDVPTPPLDFEKSYQKLKPDNFWAFLAGYPSWDGAAVYVYRLWPVIDRKLSGLKAKYISVWPNAITEKEILEEHGSGKYRLVMNDSNKPKGLHQVATTEVHIDHADIRPILNQKELIQGDDRNRGYIEGLKARGQWMEDVMPTGDSGGATAELARTLGNMVERITERPPAPAEPPRPDPFDIALRISGLVQQTVAKPAADPYETALKILDRLQPAAKPPRDVDPLEVYGKVADIIEARASRYAGASSGGTDWGAMLVEFVKALPALIQGFTMMKAMQQQPSGAPAAAGGFPLPAAQPAYPPPIDPKGAPALPEQTPNLQALFEELKPFLLKAMMQGQSGDEFASGLVTFYGEERYKQLASHGLEGLLNALKGHAELWMMLAPYEEQVRTFIQEFLDYGKDEPEAPAGEAA